MNVYTHVAMEDLATDVESLPPVLGGPQKKAKSAVQFSEADRRSRMPGDLASLAGNWESLPEHVRQAIATLCSAQPWRSRMAEA